MHVFGEMNACYSLRRQATFGGELGYELCPLPERSHKCELPISQFKTVGIYVELVVEFTQYKCRQKHDQNTHLGSRHCHYAFDDCLFIWVFRKTHIKM